MMRSAARLALSAALLLCGAALHGPAAAHNYHMGLTDISYNANTGSTEIVHTYTAHDVEALLANLYQRQFDLGQPEDQAVLRRYVERQFTISAGGKRLALQWVGVQADAASITIYQELPGSALPPGAVLRHMVLSDFIPGQLNTVNVAASPSGPAARSLTFSAATPERPLP
ncbi:hypothetical protein ASC94_07360 [Massilia sp. Root418]|jgi:hypothetical protein|uniref:DUF6702 family protein n=1 Tax=Massilia sp. Root418 TaxID=1736532 RepID=UPI0006F71A71|nr:DUF6702 family protein [Massilia sp. Root418]KQW96647.1 hypothetical protein ASC94_07360 [Massilia sp. Root418]